MLFGALPPSMLGDEAQSGGGDAEVCRLTHGVGARVRPRRGAVGLVTPRQEAVAVYPARRGRAGAIKTWCPVHYQEFQRLRDALREAKQAKDHRLVLTLGAEIVTLARRAPKLHICTPLFLRDMGRASLGQGDRPAAIGYLLQARYGFVARQSPAGEWQKQIAMIDRLVHRLCVGGSSPA